MEEATYCNPIIMKSWKLYLGDNFQDAYDNYLGYHLAKKNKWTWNEKKGRWVRSFRVINKNKNLIWCDKYQMYIEFKFHF